MNAIDLFAGAGGFSTGAVLAGCQVLWAANHWPIAVEWHTTNHPGTVHACQDLQQADFRDAPAHDILLADLREENASAAAKVLSDAGFAVSTAVVDVSSRRSVHALLETTTEIGTITGVIHTAGVSPAQASPATILKVDLYGTALILEELGNVIARGGSGVVIASQSGHRLKALTPEQNRLLATMPADELLALPMLQADQVTDSLYAYQLTKRGNSLRVMAEAVRWGKRGARVNTISSGIIATPLARDELSGPRGEIYRRMIALSAAARSGTADEAGAVAAL